MKVLHISTSDRQGGAAIAAYRLNEALQNEGVDSKMLVYNKITLNPTVERFSSFCSIWEKLFYKPLIPLRTLIKEKMLHNVVTFSMGRYWSCRIHNLPLVQEADIIYIHWINGGFLTVKEIESILKLGKPTFIFLHDMWLLTGGCHYAFSCQKYYSLCNECPTINRTSVKWICKYVFKNKERLKNYSNLHLISPSHWMDDCVGKSALFHHVDRMIIPNLLNTVRFSPIDKIVARQLLQLPLNTQLILFAADSGTQNPYKGWPLLKKALGRMSGLNMAIVVLGNFLCPDEISSFPFASYSMGKISDEYSLTLLYNAVDVYVTSSLAESFGQTIIEAQACGTIPVGFDLGGIPDIIEHEKTGYLAREKDIEDFSVAAQEDVLETVDEEFSSEINLQQDDSNEEIEIPNTLTDEKNIEDLTIQEDMPFASLDNEPSEEATEEVSSNTTFEYTTVASPSIDTSEDILEELTNQPEDNNIEAPISEENGTGEQIEALFNNDTEDVVNEDAATTEETPGLKVYPTKQKKSFLIPLSILLILIAAGALGYVGYTKFLASPPPSEDIINNETSNPEAQAAPKTEEAMPIESVEATTPQNTVNEAASETIPMIEQNLDASILVSNLKVEWEVPAAYTSNTSAKRYLTKLGKIIQ